MLFVWLVWQKRRFKDILQPGNKLVAAGYCMYGSSTQLVLTWGQGVHGFTLDPTIGAFILSHNDIKIPDDAKTVSTAQKKHLACSQSVTFAEILTSAPP